MKAHTSRNLGRALGGKKRVLALLMAFLTVISLIPVVGRITVDAATSYNNSTARDKINSMLSASDYQRQLSRSHDKGKTNINGICTWCAVRNLLNRKVALDSSTYSEYLSRQFTMPEVVKNVSGSSIYKDLGDNIIWIGNGETFPDYYDNDFSKGGYTYTTSESAFGATGKSKQDIDERKNQVKNLLDEHPEGIVVQYYRNKDNKHGIVISSYYYDSSNNLRFRVVDSVDVASGKGEINMEDAHIGKGYGNSSGNVTDNVFQHLTSYVFIAKDPIDIDLSGFKGHLPYGKPYKIPGLITTSKAMILEVNARVIHASDPYATTAKYNNGQDAKSTVTLIGDFRYPIKSHKIDNEMSLGKLNPGNYYFEIKVTDTNYRTLTKRIGFTIDYINIDFAGFSHALTAGKSYGIPGTITSYANISKIEARVTDTYFNTAKYNNNGKAASYSVNNVNATSYSIAGSNIDKNISMGRLNKGSYYFEVKVTDVYGRTNTSRIGFTIK